MNNTIEELFAKRRHVILFFHKTQAIKIKSEKFVDQRIRNNNMVTNTEEITTKNKIVNVDIILVNPNLHLHFFSVGMTSLTI